MLEYERMSLGDAKYILLQLVDALDYLYIKGIAHCDIKPGNILIDEHLNVSPA